MNPSALSSPARRAVARADQQQVRQRGGAGPPAGRPQNSGGKFTGSPKLTSTSGSAGSAGEPGVPGGVPGQRRAPGGAPGAARASTTVARPFFTERRQPACAPVPPGHCALTKALVVITAPFPSPPVPAFRDARPITRKLASMRPPARIGDRHPDALGPGAAVARVVAAPSMMSRSPRGSRPIQGRQQGSSAQRGHRFRADMVAVDVDLDADQGDLLDGTIGLKAVQQRAVDHP